MRALGELLGTGVDERANLRGRRERVAGGRGDGRGLGSLQSIGLRHVARETEVAQPQHAVLAVEDVGGLDVAVNDVLAVDVRQRAAELLAHVENLLLLHRARRVFQVIV